MRRWSLQRKILALGLLHWFLLGVGVLAYVRFRYGLGPNALLVAPAQDRIARVITEFQQDLDATDDKDSVFRAYKNRYAADFFVVGPRMGLAIAGPQPKIPPDLAARMHPPRPGPANPRPGIPGPERMDRSAPGGIEEEGRGPEGPREGPRPPGSRERFFFVTTQNPTQYWAGGRLPFGPRPAVFLIRCSSLFQSQLFFDFREWAGFGLAMLAAWLICWLPFLRSLTKSVAHLDQVTQKIAMGQFDARAPEQRGDEIGRLGGHINVLAGKLDGFVKSQKRFLGDIAHELSAPISRVHAALGILEQSVEPTHQPEIDLLHEEVQEMSTLVSELLSFSQAGLENGGLALDAVNIAETVRQIAARESVEVVSRINPEWVVKGNDAYLRRAIGNILRNAKRYAGDCCPVTVTCTRIEDRILISISDEGPGLPPEAMPHVFEPFYRSSSSRTRDTGGVGLGLAIVKSCVEACGGTVNCRNLLPGGFEVTLLLRSAES